jgi:hypothetical protein
VLHGPENDKTLGMRNWLALNLARRTGRYASRTRYFELFLHAVRRAGEDPGGGGGGQPMSAALRWLHSGRHPSSHQVYAPAVLASGAV